MVILHSPGRLAVSVDLQLSMYNSGVRGTDKKKGLGQIERS